MSKTAKVFIGFLLVLAIIVVTAIWFWGTVIIDFPTAYPTPMVMIEVIAAATDIPQGTIIKPEMLTTIEIPRDQAMEVMFFDAEEIVGKIARYLIQKGLIITKPLIAQFE